MLIEPNICGSLVWNWLHVTVIDPNICGSLAWNWFHVMLIEPNFLGPKHGTGFMSRL